MELRAALAAQRLSELRAMAHGARSGFRDTQLPDGTRGVFFGVRLLLGDHRVDASPAGRTRLALRRPRRPDTSLTDELEILARIRCPEGTPRELPTDIQPTL